MLGVRCYMFSLNDWFSLTPPALALVQERLWGGIAFACILVAVLVRWFIIRRLSQRFLQHPWQRVARLLAWSGIMLAVLLFFRYEGVPFFSARFWLFLLAVGDAIWGIAIVRHALVKLPAQRRAWSEEQQRRKYLKK